MLNPFVMKRWAALILAGLLPVIFFFTGMTFYGFTLGLVIMGLGLLLSVTLASRLMMHPFQRMVEGQGVLCLDQSSTGIIRPFIMQVKPPYVKGDLGEKLVEDIFDREMVYNLAAPVTAGNIVKGKTKEGQPRLCIILDEDEFNKARFGMFHYPVIIYNSQLRSLVTKDFLADQEKSLFAEHTILYLNTKLEELTSTLRDFGRYVVETTRKNKFEIKPIYIWIAVIIFLVVLAVIFAPKLLPALSQATKTVGSSVSNAGGAITKAG